MITMDLPQATARAMAMLWRCPPLIRRTGGAHRGYIDIQIAQDLTAAGDHRPSVDDAERIYQLAVEKKVLPYG
jgi:hypothetical protein